MKSNKILMIEAVFNLPDDFEGTWRDAVSLYSDYINDNKLKRTSPKDAGDTDLLDLFDVLFANENGKHATKANVQEFDKNERKWKIIDNMGEICH